MTAETIFNFVDAGIPLAIGVVALQLGNRALGKEPGQDFAYDGKMQTVAPTFRRCGIALIAISAIYVVVALLRAM